MKHFVLFLFSILMLVGHAKNTSTALLLGHKPLTKTEGSVKLKLEKNKRVVEISQGTKIFVKANGNKYSRSLVIINDSTIMIDSKPINLNEVTMLAKRNTFKTLGIIVASAPIIGIGVILTDPFFDAPYVGILVIAGSVTGVVLESLRGKRYPAYSLFPIKGEKKKKWTYSIV